MICLHEYQITLKNGKRKTRKGILISLAGGHGGMLVAICGQMLSGIPKLQKLMKLKKEIQDTGETWEQQNWTF